MPEAARGPAAPARTTAASAARSWGIDMLRDVEMEVTCELGRTRMTVRQLLALAPGDVVELDRLAGAPADLLVNGTLLARGEVVVVDESFGLRITEIVDPGRHMNLADDLRCSPGSRAGSSSCSWSSPRGAAGPAGAGRRQG